MSKETAYWPKTVDLNPTAKCNLDCSFCWGPDHTIQDRLSLEDCKKILLFFANEGTSSVVITGGEPLLRNDIEEILSYAKSIGLQTTLSTNGLLLKAKGDNVLPYVDDLGIPIDGSTPEKNAKMRLKLGQRSGNMKHLGTALDAIKTVSEKNPTISITIRTVASKVNFTDIHAIAELIQREDLKIDRWKIYQFAPFSIGAAHFNDHHISDEDFNSLLKRLVKEFPDLPISSQSVQVQSGRYVFVGPQGDIYGVEGTGKYERIGNIIDDDLEMLAVGILGLSSKEGQASHG